jgi:hypothetical protein
VKRKKERKAFTTEIRRYGDTEIRRKEETGKLLEKKFRLDFFLTIGMPWIYIEFFPSVLEFCAEGYNQGELFSIQTDPWDSGKLFLILFPLRFTVSL